jgi:hypothetical protein
MQLTYVVLPPLGFPIDQRSIVLESERLSATLYLHRSLDPTRCAETSGIPGLAVEHHETIDRAEGR